MYSLDFIDQLESVKERTLELQKKYISAEQDMADMQQDMTKMLEQLEQISDTNSQEFNDKLKECKNAENEYSDILEMYEELEEKLDIVKEYAKMKLQSNKEILEKYVGMQDNTEMEEKIFQLLGGEKAEKRIAQCEKALVWLEKDYRTDRFEEMYTVFEKILGIERQKPQVKFEAKTNLYTYIDELGNEIQNNFFEKNENVDLIINIAKEKGLANRQIKKIDIYIASILKQNNLKWFDNYIETIKNNEEIQLIISYDLRTNGIKKGSMLTKKELNKIKKYAIRQKAHGIANVIRDKSKLMAIMEILKIYPIIGNHYKNAITEGNNNIR